MDSIDQLIQRIESIQGNVADVLENAVDGIAANYSVSLVRRVQIQSKGTNDSLGTYSQGTSVYKKKKGQPSERVNLTDTTQMLNSIGLQDKQVSRDVIKFTVAPDKSKRKSGITNEELMAVHEKRYGEIMTPTEEEQGFIISDLEEIIQSQIDFILR